MHPLIRDLFKKNKIESIKDLSNDEQEVYEKWQKILSEGEMSIDKIVSFCNNQITLIENQWKDFNNSKEKNERLIIAYTMYRTLVDIITNPNAEKEALEKYLQDLIK